MPVHFRWPGQLSKKTLATTKWNKNSTASFLLEYSLASMAERRNVLLGGELLRIDCFLAPAENSLDAHHESIV